MALNVYLNKDKNEKEERVTVRRRLVKNIDDSDAQSKRKDNKKEDQTVETLNDLWEGGKFFFCAIDFSLQYNEDFMGEI